MQTAESIKDAQLDNRWIDAAMQCETPAYLADPDRLVSNLSGLQDAVRNEYPNVSVTYSVKTNPLAAFVTRAFEAGFHPEVMSAAEFDYVNQLGARPSQTILNGPSKTPGLLSRALAGGVLVNLDSVEELETVADLGLDHEPVSVRIATRLASGEIARFGIDLSQGDVRNRARQLASQLNVVGIQIHHSSDRSAESYAGRLDHAVEAASQLSIPHLKVIDLGGGFASKMPQSIRQQLPYQVATFEEYGEAIGARAREVFDGTDVRLILEPGIGVLADTMSYVTTVRAVKTRSEGRMAMLDGSMFEVNPLRSAIDPPAEILGHGDSSHTHATRLVGATGMEYDLLGTVAGEPRVGDRVLFTNVGAYTLTLGPDFIVPRSSVIDVTTGRQLRSRQDLRQVGGLPS